MKIIKNTLILVTLISMASCATGDSETASEEKRTFKVKYSGALKNMMHKGDIAAKADLKDFEEADHFYAIGAMENLKGEIQIFDGKPFNTMVIDSALSYDHTFNKKATLLVHASVNDWLSINIPSSVVTYEQLEQFIEQAASENMIQTDEPFPFLVEGTIQSFDWHVINWKDGDTEHSHAKHISSGLSGTVENMPVEMLGFYSNAHHAIFTHHTTNMHLHVKTVDDKIAGHVDGLQLGQGMILKLPRIK
jgi:acetolactate decarboxylase